MGITKKFPCGFFNKSVKWNQKGLLCTTCKKLIHLSCTNVTLDSYNNRLEKFVSLECANCTRKHLPFHNVSISSSVDEIVNEDLRIDLEISRDQRYAQLEACWQP